MLEPVPLLQVRNVSVAFGGLKAVDDVSMNVARGGIHAVIGPNGAGKTTLFNTVTSFTMPKSGTIVLDGKRIDGLPAHRIAAQGVARTYQNVRLFAEMSAIDNVLVGQHRHIGTTLLDAVLRTPRFAREEHAARERGLALLDFVGIAHQAGRPARDMSYGDQRRLEIARALAGQPQVLMLDEPAAGMNPAEGAVLAALILRIRNELGLTVVLIEHHMHVVMAVADRITVMVRGSVLTEGLPADVRADERVVAAYLGTRQPTALSRAVVRSDESVS